MDRIHNLVEPQLGAAHAGKLTGPDGRPLDQKSVAELDHLSGELYRKFCARCHVGKQNDATDGSGHPAGLRRPQVRGWLRADRPWE